MLRTIINKKFVFLVLLVIAAVGIPTAYVMANPHHIFVSRGTSQEGRSPTWVTPADGSNSCGTDDHWIGFRGVPQNKIMPVNKLRISATNGWNRTHIWWHGGLNGYFECYQNTWCNVFLCGKHGGGYDGWSHRLELLP